MKAFLVQWLCTTVAVAAAVKLTGMQPPADWWPFVGMALFLGVVNAVIRPLLLLLSLPIIVFTLGLFVVFINAMLFALASRVAGLAISSPWQAVGGAVIVSLVNWALGWFFRKPGVGRPFWRMEVGGSGPTLPGPSAPGEMKQVQGRVIE